MSANKCNFVSQMVPMMESIAGELCERVMRVINFRTLFASHPEDVKRRAEDAKQMMDLWKSSYLGMRARIEAAGYDARWEFDRKKLFENTECIASVCHDIANIAQVITNQYSRFQTSTSSPAVAERPRDALCLSVVSFNTTIRRAQTLLVTSASDLPLRTIQFCYLLFGVFTDAWRSLCPKQTCTVTVIHYCTDDCQLLIAHCSSHRSIAIYSSRIAICAYPTSIRRSR